MNEWNKTVNQQALCQALCSGPWEEEYQQFIYCFMFYFSLGNGSTLQFSDLKVIGKV